MQTRLPVLIVGAGPVGLTMANELLRYGISFRIIDKNIKPVKTSNALAVHARTLEIWNDLEILSAALESGVRIGRMLIYARNKEKIAQMNMDLLKSRQKMVLALAQHDSEKLLLDKLKSQNINVEMETELVDFKEAETGVEVTLRRNNNQETMHADWLIACDGIHSIVREKLGLAFKGKELDQHFLLADAEVKSELSSDALYAFITANGTLLLAPYKTENKLYWRFIIDVSHDKQLMAQNQLTYENLKSLAAERSPFALEISEPVWTSGFTIHERMIADFRHHRIFFAGDAAHVHSPAGGQGMNIGVQDAYNLAWKLALVIEKKAKPAILDSYSFERVPVAKSVLRGTAMLTRLMTIRNPILIKLRNMLFQRLTLWKTLQAKFVNTAGEMNVSYQNSSLTKECLPHKNGPKAGSSVLDVEFNGQSLHDKIRGIQFVLLIFMGMNEEADLTELNNLYQYIQGYSGTVKCLLIRTKSDIANWQGESVLDESWVLHKKYDASEPILYLTRPDKYICFRGGVQHSKELKEYLADWLIK